MIDLIRAVNPFAALETRQAALAAARATAIGIVLGAIQQALHLLYMATGGAEAAGRALEQATGSAPTAAMQAMQQGSQTISAGLILLQLALAIVQWRKPNQVLPILFLVLVGAGIALAASVLLLLLLSPGGFQEGSPIWLTVGGGTLTVLAFAAHVAGFRGARRLARFRRSDVHPDTFS